VRSSEVHPGRDSGGRGTVRGGRQRVLVMNTRMVIAAALVLGLVGTLALMNNACKTSRDAWCAPASQLPHHLKTARR
jgi:hypothetical protein